MKVEAVDNAQLDRLLNRVAAGDAVAFETLYEEMRRPVFSMAYAVLHDTGLAEDVMQDTFLILHEKGGLYRHDRNPSSWVFTIARNLALDRLKKHSRERAGLGEDGLPEPCEPGSFEDSVIQDALLEQAFRILGDAERQIVILHLVAGLKHREIAQVMDTPLGTVLWKYRRGLHKMQAVLTETGV